MTSPQRAPLSQLLRRVVGVPATAALATLSAVLACAFAAAAEPRIEIALIAPLDEPRGYCLDIVGYKTRAQPAKGMHAHTCYGYQGEIATDQAFDAADLARGRLRLPDWDLCVTASTIAPGAGVRLTGCDGRSEQRFRLGSDGTLALAGASPLCLTVDADQSRIGGGGRPPHRIRALTLMPCAAEKVLVQRWHARAAVTAPTPDGH